MLCFSLWREPGAIERGVRGTLAFFEKKESQSCVLEDEAAALDLMN